MKTMRGFGMSRQLRVAVLVATTAKLGMTVLARPVTVNWGGNYVTSTQDLNGGSTASQVIVQPVDLDNDGSDDSRVGRYFSTGTVFNPTANYGGLGGLSETFSGGAMSDWLNDTTPDKWAEMHIQNQGPNDMISFRIQQGGHQQRMHVSLFWDQATFLSGNAPITFANDASVGMSISIANADESMQDATGRWLIRQGGTFYLSNATFTPQNNTPGSSVSYDISGAALNSTTWAVWNPLGSSPSGSDLDFAGTVPAPSFTSLVLSEVTAVGFHIEHDSYHDAFNFSIDGFNVNGQPIPEPGTWAAGIALLGGVGTVCYRRYRRARA